MTTSAQLAQQTGNRTMSCAAAAIDTASAGSIATLSAAYVTRPGGRRDFTGNGTDSVSSAIAGPNSLTANAEMQPVSMNWSWSSGGNWS